MPALLVSDYLTLRPTVSVPEPGQLANLKLSGNLPVFSVWEQARAPAPAAERWQVLYNTITNNTLLAFLLHNMKHCAVHMLHKSYEVSNTEHFLLQNANIVLDISTRNWRLGDAIHWLQ